MNARFSCFRSRFLNYFGMTTAANLPYIPHVSNNLGKCEMLACIYHQRCVMTSPLCRKAVCCANRVILSLGDVATMSLRVDQMSRAVPGGF